MRPAETNTTERASYDDFSEMSQVPQPANPARLQADSVAAARGWHLLSFM